MFVSVFSLANELVYSVGLGEACVEACDILSALDLPEPSLLVLEVAPVSAVVHEREVSVDLEALELQALRVLSEDLRLRDEIVHMDAIGCHYI